MRLLPSSLVVHQWMIEANKLKLKPISVSLDGMQMHLARQETIDAYNRMTADAARENIKLKIIWAYRSVAMQTQQFAEAKKRHGERGAIKWLAPPGYSEHHTGWAIDIGDESDPQADDNPLFERTPAFRWLFRNARKYGFEMSFPKNNWQGIGYEPWHWRFIANPEAGTAFHPKGIEKLGIWSISFATAMKHWVRP